MADRGFDRFKLHANCLAMVAWPDDEPGPALADTLRGMLGEESGELSRAVRKLTGTRFGHPGEAPGTADEVADELGDVLFVCARIADLCKVSLDDAAERVLAKIQGRIDNTTGKRA